MRNSAHIENMDKIVIVAVTGLIIGLIALIMVICNELFRKRGRRNRYQNQSKSVLVKNGINVKSPVLGAGKGEYFTGNREKQRTYYVNTAVTVWKVVFDDLNTKERSYINFTRQMWIGRTEAGQNEIAKLVLCKDGRISRNHCTIYESGGTLCLQDLNFRNHTYLNGNMVTSAVYLHNDDIIKVGNTQLKVQYSRMNTRST